MIKITIFLLVFFLTVPFGTEAAEFRVESDVTSIGVGDEFLVTIWIDAQGESINALEGKIVFPERLLELQTIQEKGYKVGHDFGLGYCPERIDPLNQKWKLENIPRVIYCSDDTTFEISQLIYKYVNN